MKLGRIFSILASAVVGLLLVGCTHNEKPSTTFTAPSNMLYLLSIECKNTTLGSNLDQVYIKVNGKKSYPEKGAAYSMTRGDVWEPGLILNAEKSGTIELVEYDRWTADENIGTFKFNNIPVGTHTAKMVGDNAIYELKFVVLAPDEKRLPINPSSISNTDSNKITNKG
ncbi:MAG: hypothetical protein ABJH63_04835 [Rhizobiaceae bacterium]